MPIKSPNTFPDTSPSKLPVTFPVNELEFVRVVPPYVRIWFACGLTISTSAKSLNTLLSKTSLLLAPSTNGAESSPNKLPVTSVIIFGTVKVPLAVMSPSILILPKPNILLPLRSKSDPN